MLISLIRHIHVEVHVIRVISILHLPLISDNANTIDFLNLGRIFNARKVKVGYFM